MTWQIFEKRALAHHFQRQWIHARAVRAKCLLRKMMCQIFAKRALTNQKCRQGYIMDTCERTRFYTINDVRKIYVIKLLAFSMLCVLKTRICAPMDLWDIDEWFLNEYFKSILWISKNISEKNKFWNRIEKSLLPPPFFKKRFFVHEKIYYLKAWYYAYNHAKSQ